jgi:hypothetical protein
MRGKRIRCLRRGFAKPVAAEALLVIALLCSVNTQRKETYEVFETS